MGSFLSKYEDLSRIQFVQPRSGRNLKVTGAVRTNGRYGCVVHIGANKVWVVGSDIHKYAHSYRAWYRYIRVVEALHALHLISDETLQGAKEGAAKYDQEYELKHDRSELERLKRKYGEDFSGLPEENEESREETRHE